VGVGWGVFVAVEDGISVDVELGVAVGVFVKVEAGTNITVGEEVGVAETVNSKAGVKLDESIGVELHACSKTKTTVRNKRQKVLFII